MCVIAAGGLSDTSARFGPSFCKTLPSDHRLSVHGSSSALHHDRSIHAAAAVCVQVAFEVKLTGTSAHGACGPSGESGVTGVGCLRFGCTIKFECTCIGVCKRHKK